MALIRLQDKVPSVYIDRSRDFQLFCRLYDVVLNGVKYDTDGVARITNSHDCKSTVLRLLQTKVGFLTEKEFTDTTLRYIIQCFPMLVKKKGTVKAIEESVRMFLKINGIETMIKVNLVNDEPTDTEKLEYGPLVTDHSVVIGIESDVRDITSLQEVLKYILPFGYNLFFYFFTAQQQEEVITHKEKAKIIIAGNRVNDMSGSTAKIAKNEDGTYKDWTDTLGPFNISLTVVDSDTIQIPATSGKVIGSYTRTYDSVGRLYNQTTDETCRILSETKILDVTGTPISAKYKLDKSVSWKIDDVIYYQQGGYNEEIEERMVSAINTTEVRTDDRSLGTIDALSDIITIGE